MLISACFEFDSVIYCNFCLLLLFVCFGFHLFIDADVW